MYLFSFHSHQNSLHCTPEKKNIVVRFFSWENYDKILHWPEKILLISQLFQFHIQNNKWTCKLDFQKKCHQTSLWKFCNTYSNPMHMRIWIIKTGTLFEKYSGRDILEEMLDIFMTSQRLIYSVSFSVIFLKLWAFLKINLAPGISFFLKSIDRKVIQTYVVFDIFQKPRDRIFLK